MSNSTAGYKSRPFSIEDEIRLLKVFPYGYDVLDESEFEGRRRIIEYIEPDIQITMLSEHP